MSATKRLTATAMNFRLLRARKAAKPVYAFADRAAALE
jgi:hypothetical protein